MHESKIVNLIPIFVILFALSATATSQEKAAEPNSDSNDLTLTIIYDNKGDCQGSKRTKGQESSSLSLFR
jgi:hypothetical protein